MKKKNSTDRNLTIFYIEKQLRSRYCWCFVIYVVDGCEGTRKGESLWGRCSVVTLTLVGEDTRRETDVNEGLLERELE